MTQPIQAVRGRERLEHIARELAGGARAEGVSVRELLAWFGEKRRGYTAVRTIQDELQRLGLETSPAFDEVFIDEQVEWRLADKSEDPRSDGRSGARIPAPVTSGKPTREPSYRDPTFRVGRLPSANRPLVSVDGDCTVRHATTLMLLHGYSQLPVLQGERTVKGAVSWRSIGAAASMGKACETVKECMEEPIIVGEDQPLFTVLHFVLDSDYVLVRGRDNRIGGIVTTSDLGVQFRQLAEPFLLLGEIENHLRAQLEAAFDRSELARMVNPDEPRPVQSVHDLTFGEYLRILENPELFGRVGLPIDRRAFVGRLEQVRRLRNEVMHFNPDPFTEEELDVLRSFAAFMRQVRAHRGLGSA